MPKTESASPECPAGVNLGIVALVGNRDEPTDALRDYCACLGDAMGRRGVAMETVEVRWDQQGWLTVLAKLWKQSARWRGRWVLLQYTALMWSRRGFPLSVPIVIGILKIRGCRTGVVFHDVYAVPGPRWIHRVRIALQRRIMRFAYQWTDLSVLPVPLDGVPWLSAAATKAVFIPVGANIPSFDDLARQGTVLERRSPPAVAVFGLSTWPSAQSQEIEAIVHAMRHANSKLGELRLLVIGRGAKEAEAPLQAGLSGSRVSLTVEGVLNAEQVSTRLCASDVLLFVRGPLSSRRGSGLAGIACGLPLVAYEGQETGVPLRDAGIVFVPQDNLSTLADRLTEVLSDPELRHSLSERSVAIFHKWFSWDQIAERLVEALAKANA